MSRPTHTCHKSLLEQARQWAFQLKSGQVRAAELQQFRAWQAQSSAHQQAWLQAVREWHLLQQASVQKAQEQHATHLVLPSPQRRKFLAGFTAAGLSAVAGAVIINPPLHLWPSWKEWGADFRTATGEQKHIELGNELTVLLNTQSSMTVKQQAHTTEVHLLQGEAAFFSQGQACTVFAADTAIFLEHGEMDIQLAQNNKTRLRCSSGQLRLRHAQGEYMLYASEQLSFTSAQIDTTHSYDSSDLDWRQGVLRFNKQSLEQVISEINRYRPGKVILLNSNLAQRPFSGEFRLQDIDDALLLLQKSYQLQARHLGTLVMLS